MTTSLPFTTPPSTTPPSQTPPSTTPPPQPPPRSALPRPGFRLPGLRIPGIRLPNPFARRTPAPDTAAAPEPIVLSAESVEIIGRELDAIRDRIVADLGTADRDYILGVVRTQRRL